MLPISGQVEEHPHFTSMETETDISKIGKYTLGGSDAKESACNVRDAGSIPGSRRFPGEGNGYPLQYSCLENSIGK